MSEDVRVTLNDARSYLSEGDFTQLVSCLKIIKDYHTRGRFAPSSVIAWHDVLVDEIREKKASDMAYKAAESHLEDFESKIDRIIWQISDQDNKNARGSYKLAFRMEKARENGY